jgi:hypothetical protein
MMVSFDGLVFFEMSAARIVHEGARGGNGKGALKFPWEGT